MSNGHLASASRAARGGHIKAEGRERIGTRGGFSRTSRDRTRRPCRPNLSQLFYPPSISTCLASRARPLVSVLAIELSPRRCDHRFLRESRSTSGPGTACSLRRRYLVGWTLGILGNPVARWRTFGRIYLAVMLSFILIFELFVSFTHYDVLYAMLGESRAVSTLS